MTEQKTPRASKAVGQALAATAGLAIGGPVGAIIGAAVSEEFVELAGHAWGELQDARRQSVGALLGEAAEHLDTPADDMVRAALSDTHTAQLLHDAMTAAADTLLHQKVHGLAKALANGLADDGALVNEETLVVAALADLETPHIKVLAVMARAQKQLRSSRIADTAGLELMAPVLAVLQRHGLVDADKSDRDARLREQVVKQALKEAEEKSRGGLSGRYGRQRHVGGVRYVTTWYITTFGVRCLEYLDALPEGAGDETSEVEA